MAAHRHHLRPKDTPGTPPRKPLYLVSSLPLTVAGNSESLLLRRPNMPIQRFPLARIARVICSRHATWTGHALGRCLSEGVVITWVDQHGCALGSAQPRQATTSDTASLIDTWLELPDWPQRFANWRARRRLETLTAWTLRATRAGHAPTPSTFAERKRSYVYGGEFELIFDPQGEAWCHAYVADHLRRNALEIRYWGFDGTPFELCAELSALLWAELNFDCGSLPASAAPGTFTAHLFEAWIREHEHRLLEHMGDFRRHLAREIDRWH